MSSAVNGSEAKRARTEDAPALETIQAEVHQGLATVVLHRPKKLNALTIDMIRQLSALLRQWQVILALTVVACVSRWCAAAW